MYLMFTSNKITVEMNGGGKKKAHNYPCSEQEPPSLTSYSYMCFI